MIDNLTFIQLGEKAIEEERRLEGKGKKELSSSVLTLAVCVFFLLNLITFLPSFFFFFFAYQWGGSDLCSLSTCPNMDRQRLLHFHVLMKVILSASSSTQHSIQCSLSLSLSFAFSSLISCVHLLNYILSRMDGEINYVLQSFQPKKKKY